jgi:hypothetical protein
MFVAAQIQAEVDEIDEDTRRQTTDDNDHDDLERDASKDAQELISPSVLAPPIDSVNGSSSEQGNKTFGVSVLRSQQPPVTLDSLESLGPTFRNFRGRLAHWINNTFPTYGCPFAPGLLTVALQADDKASFASGLVCTLIVI